MTTMGAASLVATLAYFATGAFAYSVADTGGLMGVLYLLLGIDLEMA